MRSLTSNITTALAARVLKRRNFIWITGYDFVTRAATSTGFWDDLGNVTASYIDVADGSTKSRAYTGAGSLITLDNIPLIGDITVRNISATLSQLNTDVLAQMRGYDLHGAPIEIHRGYFNPGTYVLADALVPRFVGFIDKCNIKDPQQGNDGSITLSLVSHTRLLTRTNPELRSDPSQQLRAAGDNFYQDTPTCGNWQIFWGEDKGSAASTTASPPAVQAGGNGPNRNA